MYIQQPKFTLIDVGPGEVDLITVKGLKSLRTAKVILYDNAVNETLLLEYAPNEALKIFIGEKGRNKAFTSSDLQEIIVEYAALYGHIVQLKGSNSAPIEPEVVQYIRSRGLHTDYIPGVPGRIPVLRSAIPSSN